MVRPGLHGRADSTEWDAHPRLQANDRCLRRGNVQASESARGTSDSNEEERWPKERRRETRRRKQRQGRLLVSNTLDLTTHKGNDSSGLPCMRRSCHAPSQAEMDVVPAGVDRVCGAPSPGATRGAHQGPLTNSVVPTKCVMTSRHSNSCILSVDYHFKSLKHDRHAVDNRRSAVDKG